MMLPLSIWIAPPRPWGWWRPVLMLLLMSLALSGCIRKKPVVTYSGFLGDYQQLQPSADHEGVLVWINSYAPIRLYNRLIVEPATLYFSQDLQKRPFFPTRLAIQATDRITRSLTQGLDARYKLTDQPGHGVARIQTALTGATLNREALADAPVQTWALVVEGIQDPEDDPDKVAVLSLESRMVDSLTGKLLAKFILHKGTYTREVPPDRLTSQTLNPIIDYWVQLLKLHIDQAYAEKNGDT